MANTIRTTNPNSRTLCLKEALAHAQALYVLPKDHVTSAVLIPALEVTKSLRVMMGYFSSSSFVEIAPGLATFLRTTDAPFEMVISPFFTDEDFETLMRDEEGLAHYAQRMFLVDVPDEDALIRHTLECLAWLIDQGRLILKIALMRAAMFHHKVWLFDDVVSRVALHGSTNLTMSGLSRNREQLTLSRDWKGEEAVFHIERLRQEFDDLWSGGDEDCVVLPLPEAIARKVIERYKTKDIPDERIFEDLWQKAHDVDVATDTETQTTGALKIPPGLIYETGDFAHQGKAIKAWEAQGRRGILEMATGSGKTITSMIGATRLQEEVGNLLVVVSAPYRPLIAQWCDEIREFSVHPINLTDVGGPERRNREIRQACRRLRMGHTQAEVLVVSNDTLCSEPFIQKLTEAVNAHKLLIADECHNLGAATFSANPPEIFDYRLGLSATPVRQYDEEGTEALMDFFGEICFSFTLEEAIGKCLTEYDYHVNFIELTPNEMQKWTDLTEQIGNQVWTLEIGSKNSYLDNLLRQRRLVLETADGKIDALAGLLDLEGPRELRYTLIYATDKEPEHLEEANRLLECRGVLFHQLTQEETRSKKKTKSILSAFQDGMTQVLTAKRVLDEGVNIPQIKLAYILASTTVRRQWVQRRGRLLRKCSAIGKTHAVIHDFVVLPPGTSSATVEQLDQDARRLVRSELDRVWEFARLSRNGPIAGGPYEAVEHLQSLANERVAD